MSSVLIVAAVCCTVALWWLICSFLFFPEHCLCQNKGTESPVQRKTSIEKSLVLPAINHLNQKGQRLFEASLLPSACSTSSFISPPVRAAPLNVASIVFECKCVFLHPFLAAKTDICILRRREYLLSYSIWKKWYLFVFVLIWRHVSHESAGRRGLLVCNGNDFVR